MHVADVKAGMVGYGLTVFTGAKIDKFDVQVVDVVENLVNPKCSVVLITCGGDYLQHVGSVEGMSGSPIYLYNLDDTQHAHPRLIGAFAYGWEFAKDPLAGVEPIEYMLKIKQTPGEGEGSDAPPQPTGANAGSQMAGAAWSLADVPALPGFSHNAAGFAAAPLCDESAPSGPAYGELRPLATPLLCGGLSAVAAEKIRPLFAGTGLNLLQAGGSSSSSGMNIPQVHLEPGSSLVAPIVMGDMNMTAIGTTTEVRGNRIFGFGHEFNNEGPIRLPMGSGTVSTVVADVRSSFKLGSLAQVVGTLTNDQTVGIAGNVGETAPLIPLTVRIHYDDGSLDQTYHCQTVVHPKFTPLAAAAVVQGALEGVKALPQYHTVNYDLNLTFANGKTVRVDNIDVNDDSSDVAQQVALPIMAAAENPFEHVALTGIDGTVDVSNHPQLAEIISIMLPKLKYAPGEQVKGFATSRPWHDRERTMPFGFEVPKDLPNGQYQLVVSDWDRYFSDQRQAEAFEFTAENINEVFNVVNDFEAVRHNALYLRLVRQPDGVAVGRQALVGLPGNVRTALLDAGRSDLTGFVTSTVQTVPTDMVMSGAAEFTVTIDRHEHVESAKPAKPATQP
jgi:hypothetical protein